MKITITSKNLNPSDATKQAVEKKLSKLDKYFASETEAKVVMTNEKNNKVKLEATINADGLIFRAEERSNDLVFCLDKVVDKLASQMSRFKTKLVKKHKDQKEILFADIPEPEQEPEELSVIKTKHFKLTAMSSEEAIIQMELLQHDFFVYKDYESGRVQIIYKRAEESYGLLDIED